ncbi:MAG: class I SAM-dependent methyltransferase [Vicinamibacterales bacterium]
MREDAEGCSTGVALLQHVKVREYDLIADWYAAERVDHTGVPEALALARLLPAGARVLDIGCGNGKPITEALLTADVRVVGMDSATTMLARFRLNVPAAPAVRAVAQTLPFVDERFEGAIAWGVMFHLPQAEEVKVIASVARVLRPGGSFLFTAGDVADDSGDHVGIMNGVSFRYYSFTMDSYRRLLADHGFHVVGFHKDAGNNGHYLAAKRL